MSRRLHAGDVIPRGLVIDHVEVGAVLTITVRPVAASARCPGCDRSSSRIHSHYTRTLSDLPVGQTEGQITRLKLVKRQMFGRAKLDLLEARLIGAS